MLSNALGNPFGEALVKLIIKMSDRFPGKSLQLLERTNVDEVVIHHEKHEPHQKEKTNLGDAFLNRKTDRSSENDFDE